jgi:phosphoadenosine phosphosulfate reductase
LQRKWQKALKLIKKCAANSALFFTGDKESTLLLELRKGLNIPVIFVDTGLYPEELYQYLASAEEHWGFKATVLKDRKVVEEGTAFGKEECYKLLKDNVVVPYLMKEGISTLIESARSEKETVKRGEIRHAFPLLGFSDLEIWQLIRDYNLIYCDLYNKGYRDVGCEPCSKAETKNDVDQIEISRKLKTLGYL